MQGGDNHGLPTHMLGGGPGPAQQAGHGRGMGPVAPTLGLVVDTKQEQQLFMAANTGQPTCLLHLLCVTVMLFLQGQALGGISSRVLACGASELSPSSMNRCIVAPVASLQYGWIGYNSSGQAYCT